MGNFKRWTALSMAVVLSALAMTGCFGGNDSSSSSSSSSGSTAEQATVDIYQFKVEIADELQKAINVYMDKNPNVKINLETVGGGDDYHASLRTKMQSGNGAEIFNIGGPQDTMDWMEKLEDLSDQPWVKEASKGTLLGVTKDDKVYGLPFAIEGYGIIYNKEIFEAAGIDTTKLTSFTEIEAAFKTLQTKISSGAMKAQYPDLEAVFELPASETWVTGLHTLNLALTNEFPGPMEAFDAKTVEFKHSAALKELFDLQANYTKNASQKEKLNAVDYNTQVGGGIAIERVAAIQQGNWIYSDVEKIDTAVAGKLSMMPLPLKGTANENVIPTGVPMYWAVNKEAKEADKKAAKDFLNWLYQSDEGKNIIVNDFKFIPPFTNYGSLEPKDPLSQVVKSYSDKEQTLPWIFMSFPTDWGQNTFGTELQKYFAGKATWEQVVETSKAKWAEVRK